MDAVCARIWAAVIVVIDCSWSSLAPHSPISRRQASHERLTRRVGHVLPPLFASPSARLLGFCRDHRIWHALGAMMPAVMKEPTLNVRERTLP